MAQLRAGRLADFSDSMAEAIETALQEEWQAAKGTALPTIGQDDRRLLFVAIARGVLQYLKTHEDEILTNITLVDGGVFSPQVTNLDLNYSGS